MENEPKTIPVLIIDQWNDRFENAKSRVISQKTYGQYPLKQGLGYCHLMLNKNGPAIFGAFMALANIVHSKPSETRKGYLTSTGDETGYPLSFNDMAMLTRMPVKVIKAALKVLTQHPVEWIQLGSMEIPEGYLEDIKVSAEYASYCIVHTVHTVHTTREEKTQDVTQDFELFWEAYPKKRKKQDAKKAWEQTKKERPDIQFILDKLELLKSSKDWTKEQGQFIPYPASWIRAGGWDDEVEVETRSGRPSTPAPAFSLRYRKPGGYVASMTFSSQEQMAAHILKEDLIPGDGGVYEKRK